MTQAPYARVDGRAFDQMRPLTLEPRYLASTPASCLIRMGDTWVLCSAAVEERVPPFLVGKGKGWVTAEYAMIPPSSPQRVPWGRGTTGGRQQEISRLIGRSLRAAVDLARLGERSITIDCTVIQADGGTRTAGVSGAWVALALAVHDLLESGRLGSSPLLAPVAAVSVGLVDGVALLDLPYSEDSRAEADLNLVINGLDEVVEIQGTAETKPFSRQQLDELLDLGVAGIRRIFKAQRDTLEGALGPEAVVRVAGTRYSTG